MSKAAQISYLLICLISIVKNANLQNVCPDIPKVHIVPGLGWDALKNEDTKQLMQLSYNECKLTKDRKYLIPDNTVAITLPFEEKHIIGEIFEHWSNYTSPTSSGFKTTTDNTTILPLYYSFSNEYQEMKNLQVKHQATICRTQLKQIFHRIHSNYNSVLTESATERFMEVIRAIEHNHTAEAVGKIVETIIRDFGTHYSNRIDVGTILLRNDYLNENFYRGNENRKGIIISASKLSLLDYTGFSWTDRQYLDSSLLDDYNAATLEKKIRFYGGPNWDREVRAENMVAIDKSGHLLSNLITSVNFPNISYAVINKAIQAINDGIRDYFDRNVHYGCTNPKSKSFDFSKNLDDGSCSPQVTSDYVFGGVYEKCESMTNQYQAHTVCSGNAINNPLTQTAACPTNFQPTTLDERFTVYSMPHYRRVELVSCVGKSSPGLSYMFGGLFSSNVVNSFTKSKSCPPSYKALTVLQGTLSICINTTNDNNAKRYALPFGGLVSCSTEFQCPDGYDKHLAVTNNNKNIYYCLRGPNLKNFGIIPTLVRPPYKVKK